MRAASSLLALDLAVPESLASEKTTPNAAFGPRRATSWIGSELPVRFWISVLVAAPSRRSAARGIKAPVRHAPSQRQRRRGQGEDDPLHLATAHGRLALYIEQYIRGVLPWKMGIGLPQVGAQS